MRMMHICKSNKYRIMICRISQKPIKDRKIKTVKFLLFVKYINIIHTNMLRLKQGNKYRVHKLTGGIETRATFFLR